MAAGAGFKLGCTLSRKRGGWLWGVSHQFPLIQRDISGLTKGRPLFTFHLAGYGKELKEVP